MRAPRLVGAASLLLLGVGLAVFGYNLWAYSCGQCTLQTLGYFGPFGWLLLIASAAVGFTLLWLRRRRVRAGAARRCRCGEGRDPAWAFCPHCGQPAGEAATGR